MGADYKVIIKTIGIAVINGNPGWTGGKPSAWRKIQA